MHVVVHQTLFSCRIIRKWGTFLKSVKMLIHLQSLNMVDMVNIKCHQILTLNTKLSLKTQFTTQ